MKRFAVTLVLLLALFVLACSFSAYALADPSPTGIIIDAS